MRDQIPVLNDTIEYQRKLIDEFKQIIEDKNTVLDAWSKKYQDLAIEVGHLREMMRITSDTANID